MSSARDPLPTQDELPYDDGEPREPSKHREQMNLLIETLRRHLGDRPDVYIAGNMGLYFSSVQIRKNDFRAPDFFVVLDAIPDRERKSWVVWEENGRTPDVVIELLSDRTRANDRGRKRQIYARLKVLQYYLFDPHTCELEGFQLEGGALVPMRPHVDGDFDCPALGLRLGVVEGTFQGRTTRWLRWKTPDGAVVPTGEEVARAEGTRAEAEKARAERLAAKLRAMGVDPEQ